MTGQRAEGKGQREVKGRRGNGTILPVALTLLAIVGRGFSPAVHAGREGPAYVAPAVEAGQQIVILVRHAERADGGAKADMMSKAPADPSLSEAGVARATKLAAMLADSGIGAIYATEFKRTQETGRPLAAKLGLTIQPIPSADAAAVVARARADHKGGTVLVIGHSNTVPDIIKAFGGPDVKMADNEYDAIYVLVPATGGLTLIRY